MPNKNKEKPSEKTTLENIEKHLKNQDKEIKDLMERSRKFSYGLGIYIAGIVQLSILCATLLINSSSTFNFPIQAEIYSPLITGAILLFSGALLVEKARKSH